MIRRPPSSTLFPYPPLFRSIVDRGVEIRHRRVPPSLELVTELLMLAVEHLAPAQLVNRPVLRGGRSEEHTSELQSRLHLVCRLLLEKKKTTIYTHTAHNRD